MTRHSHSIHATAGFLALLLGCPVWGAGDPPPPEREQAQATQPAESGQPAVRKPPVPPREPPPTTQPTATRPATSQPTPTREEDVITTPSGLKYVDLRVGDGDTPAPTARVTVNYWGWLENGELFDSSDKRGRPASFQINRVIKGWTEGVGSMRVGGKRKLVIPPDLGYGEKGTPGIPPNSTLTFEVELLDCSPRMPDLGALDLVTTESGLKYHDFAEGEGKSPSALAAAIFHYCGWLGDGTFWQESRKEQPMRMPVANKTLKGWSEGIQSMKAGGRRLLVMPPDLAYGSRRVPGVPPDSTLVMEVELIEIVEPPTLTETKEEELITTPSGLKYQDLKVGKGRSPNPDSVVTVHYTGWLEDGTAFISSVPGNRPTSFRLDGTNKGLTEGIGSMKVGGKRKLIIPPELGYGEAGQPPEIPGNATLIYEVELIAARDVPARPATQPSRRITPNLKRIYPKEKKPDKPDATGAGGPPK